MIVRRATFEDLDQLAVLFDEYRQFYVRYSEPTHIKHSKVRLLSKLANPETAPDIVAELGELVADIDETMGRLAVRSMGSIALHDSGGQGAVDAHRTTR